MVIPASSAKILFGILDEMGRGTTITVIPVHAELTTQKAADRLSLREEGLSSQCRMATMRGLQNTRLSTELPQMVVGMEVSPPHPFQIRHRAKKSMIDSHLLWIAEPVQFG